MTVGWDERQLLGCVAGAVLAPSVHNTQPWLFRLRMDGLDVYADPRRLLAVADPTGRQLWTSVGAAVANAQVAVEARGRQCYLRMLPDPACPGLAAELRIGGKRPLGRAERLLAKAVRDRHTDRRPFNGAMPPQHLLDLLRAEARASRVGLALLVEDDAEEALAVTRAAEASHRADPAYLRELARWTTGRADRWDGVPVGAFGPAPLWDLVPVRDFTSGQPQAARRPARFEAEPLLAVLVTAADRPADWLRAGLAMQRVLLLATTHGLATSFLTQPLEFPALRTRLADRLGDQLDDDLGDDFGDPDSRQVQVLLRLGYRTGPPLPLTPRRTRGEVLIDTAAEAPGWPASGSPRPAVSGR